MKKRRLKLVIIILSVFITGVIYYILFSNGLGKPCFIYKLTGYKCAGCGASRMFYSILHLDFKSAFYYNALFLTLMPIWFVTVFNYCFNYVKYARTFLSKWQITVIITSAVLMFIFAILRNFLFVSIY